MKTMEIKHGDVSTYTNHKCRCDECKTAATDLARVYRAGRVPPPPGDPRHGHNSTYTNYKCRCVECREAHAIYKRGREPRCSYDNAVLDEAMVCPKCGTDWAAVAA